MLPQTAQSHVFLITGVATAGLGLVGVLAVLYRSVTHRSQTAFSLDLGLFGFVGLVFLLLGLLLFLFWKNSAIITDREGIRKTDIWGKPKVKLLWSQIDRVTKRNDVDEQTFYCLFAGKMNLSFSRSIQGYEQLDRTIRGNAPNLDYSSWDAR